MSASVMFGVTTNRPATDGSQQFHVLVRVGLLVVALGALAGVVLALMLLVVATHINSRLFALAVLVALLLASWWALSKRFQWRGSRSTVVVSGMAIVSGLLVLAGWESPSGRVAPESSLVSVYRGTERFSHFSPVWMVDEADRIRLGGICSRSLTL